MFGWDALLQISDENGWSLIHVGLLEYSSRWFHAHWYAVLKETHHLGSRSPFLLDGKQQAVRAGHLDVVHQLLEDGAEDIRRETHYQQQPLDIARTLLGEDHVMTQFLIQHAGTHRGAYDSEPDL
jgi:hypothetical protein